MELLSTEFLIALLTIIVIDLVLAGDNAIVIGLTARNLPKHQQKKVIIWGTVGAVVIRVVATIVVVWLLTIPGLNLAGGIILTWIAYKLTVQKKQHTSKGAVTSLWKAISTIIVADTVMGLDNVLAVAGAAHGDFLLVVIGLLISIPIMVYGSTLVIRLIDRYPFAIYIGAGVLAFTAGKMITSEHLLHSVISNSSILKWIFIVLLTVLVLIAGYFRNSQRMQEGKTKEKQLSKEESKHGTNLA